MLPKKFDTEGIKRFYRHNLLGLLITLEVWIVLYNVYFLLTGGEASFMSWFEMATFSKKVPLSHWWYIPHILSMYLALPFVGLALQNMEVKSCALPLIFVVLIAFVIPTFNNCYAAQFNLEPIETTLNSSYLGGAYMAYIVIGYLIFRKKLLGDTNPWILVVILLLSLIFSIGICLQSFDIWYDNIWILLASCCLAELIRRASVLCGDVFRAKMPMATSFITAVSKGAFGVYLVHNPIKLLVAPYIPSFSSAALCCAYLFAATWVLSVAFICLLLAATRRLPKLRRVLLDA